VDFPLLDISYTWNHMICDFLCLFFHLATSRITHVTACTSNFFFIVENHFIHSLVDGHLGLFHFGAIVMLL
jgi:hypothetical protein